jgi:type IV pilus assembly protein PilV
MKETRIKTEDGFTLIEVLIAISIFMIGVLAVASLQAAALRSNAHSMGLTEAVNAAQEQVEQILAAPFDPADSFFTANHDIDYTSPLGEQYNIGWQVTDWHDWDGDGTNEAAEIAVTVSWAGMTGARSINFNFMKTTRF